jgi:hypothetical protein
MLKFLALLAVALDLREGYCASETLKIDKKAETEYCLRPSIEIIDEIRITPSSWTARVYSAVQLKTSP